MWGHVNELTDLLKENTGNMFGSNRGCICKIHLKLGFNVNLSHSLQFEVGLYVKSKTAKVSRIHAPQRPWKYRAQWLLAVSRVWWKKHKLSHTGWSWRPSSPGHHQMSYSASLDFNFFLKCNYYARLILVQNRCSDNIYICERILICILFFFILLD